MWSFSPAQRWSCSLEWIWMETLSLSEAGDDQSCTSVAVAFSYLIIWLWELFKLLEKQTQPVPKAHLMQSGRHLGVWIKLNKCFEAAQGPTAVDVQHKQMTSVKSAELSSFVVAYIKICSGQNPNKRDRRCFLTSTYSSIFQDHL